MWRVLSFKTIISQNLKDTPLSLSVHPQLSVIPPRISGTGMTPYIENGSNMLPLTGRFT
jgi:hypothetical protein